MPTQLRLMAVLAHPDDEALALGRRASAACMHPVEVRPFEGLA